MRLQEEMELRADLERELEDTATAAQELWESMQTLCTGGSEAPESAAHSTRAHSPTDSVVEEWGTPPGAASPAQAWAASPRAGAPPQLADALEHRGRPGSGGGLLSPLEGKLASLSSRLVGLVSWLDTRDTPSPASTPASTH